MNTRVRPDLNKMPLLFMALCLLNSFFFTTAAVAAAKGINLYSPDNRKIAPELITSQTDGKQYSLNKYSGKVRIVNFWSGWCIPCLKEMPSLDLLSHRLKDSNVTIVAVAVGDSLKDVRTYQQTTNISLPLIADPDNSISEAWGIIVVPTSYIVDQKGYIAARVIGDYDWQSQEIGQLLDNIGDGL